MKSVEMGRGRIFVITLDTGESVRGSVEAFCSAKGISCAKLIVLGGIQAGSSFVSGPQTADGKEIIPISPIIRTTDAPTEFVGEGTVFPDEFGRPVLHMHGSLGRGGSSSTGCFREGARAWLTLEIILEELVGTGPVRRFERELAVSPLCLD